MLEGIISIDNYKYNVYGIDSSSSLSLRLSSNNYNNILYMAGLDEEQGDELWERGVNIGVSKVTVETHVGVDSTTGKKVKSPINIDMFCRIGAVIRYIKSNCAIKNIVGFTGLKLASGEYSPEAITGYKVVVDCEEQEVAEISLKLGSIYSIKCNIGGILVDLKWNNYIENDLMPVFKDGVQKGFSFSSEYMGVHMLGQRLVNTNIIGGLYQTLDDVIQAHPDKEFSWLRGRDYRIVTDDTLEEVCDYIYNYDGRVYFDTETTGLNINFKSRLGQADQCVGIILSVKDGESFYFPMQMKLIKNLCGGDHFYFMNRYMRPILEEKDIVVHNLEFDWKVAYIYDININCVDDTYAIYKLTLGNENFDLRVGLKELTKMFLHRDALELSDLVTSNTWGEDDIKFWDLPAELVKYYACADSDDTRGIERYAKQADLLTKYNAHKVYEIELAFSYAVAYQEFYGHLFDIDAVAKLREEIMANIDTLYSKMVGLIGHEFNPNSSPQLLKILYKELGIPEQISRKTGRPTADKDTLKHLSELTDIEGNIKYPFASLLQDYRVNEGVRKIIDSFPEVATTDGYIFSSVQQFGTTTGRVSIKEPNYQSYNDPVKKNIIARPGYYMFDTDYSSIEYRVLANMAGNKMIKDNFYDPDFDYHTYQASRMYRVPYSSVTSKLRKAAKGINFGLPYGMGDESLGVRIFGEASPENTHKASALRKSYFKGQEDIELFFNTARNNGVQNGFTETNFGRRRYYNKSKFSVNAIKRQSGNFVIQGTSADLYKLAVGRVFRRICKEGWLGKVLLDGFIHDELLGEVSCDINPMHFLKVLREEFELKVKDKDGTDWCPLYMGFGWGRNWYEAKKTEIPIKLQWEFCKDDSNRWYRDWKGNIDEFCDDIPVMLRDFHIRDCGKQLLDEENQGKEIKPALNTEILDVLLDDGIAYSDYKKYGGSLSDYNIQSLAYDDEGNIIDIYTMFYNDKGKPKKDLGSIIGTQGAITLFCKLHNFDRDNINILDFKDFDISSNVSNELGDGDYDNDSDEEVSKELLQRQINARVETLGLFVDIPNKLVLLKLVPNNYMEYIKSHTQPYKEDMTNAYRVYFLDTDKKQKFRTDVCISTKDIKTIQDMYISYMKAIRR